MENVNLGEKVPNFKMPTTPNQTVELDDYAGNHLVLYFYPKDDTPGCTTEAESFRDHYDQFKALDTEILGVSRDSPASHEKFRAKHALPFALAADTEEQLCKAFDVIKEKNMYGRKVLGIERSTFLIDRDGVLRRAWRKVKVRGHIEGLLEAVKTL